jgi:F-type H+-transporting ATPase subunit b
MLTLFLSTLAHAQEHGAAHGAEAAHAGEQGGIPWDGLAYSTGTLVLFVAVLVVFARKPISDALKTRALDIRHGLDEAARLREESQSRFSDVEAKLVALDRRIDEMKTEALADTERESDRLRERADADAARIKDTAERTIREEAQAARNALQSEAARLAVALARETLEKNVNRDDQERLARDFLAAVKDEAPHD